jgi:ethanolamine utilization protein EutA (predicted chaperonin)
MIQVFSRNAMIDYIMSHGVLPYVYYISILPTGGPHSFPIFNENYPNVITLIFDDVLMDCVKTNPGSNSLRFARAMTKKQADELCKFIKRVPTNATINIHCVEGKSRSLGMALAIENKEFNLLCNKHVYDLVREGLYK